MGEVEHYEIASGSGPSGVALGIMMASFWDENLGAKELKFGLLCPRDQSVPGLHTTKRIGVSITKLGKLEQIDGSAGKMAFLSGTCRLEIPETEQEREFFAVYYPDPHWGWMDIGPKLADNYGQEAVDKYKSTYASDD